MGSDEDNPANFDQYGFPHKYSFNRARQYKSTPPADKSNKYIVAKTLGIAFLIFIICSGIISGYHAWREFPTDSIWIKLVRVWIAVIFAPLYMFYVFVKTTVFKDV